MQISSLPIVVPTTPQSQRPDIAERVQKEVSRQADQPVEQADDGRSLEEQQASNNDVQQQRIEARNEITRINTRSSGDSESLPLNIQRALQAFNDNSPTPEQRLGIELIGVDTFA